MRKCLCVIWLLVIMLACCMTACSEAENPIDITSLKLSEDKKVEMQKVWLEKEGHPMGELWYDPEMPETGLASLRYYGSYEGFDIIFFSTMCEEITTEIIAQIDFIHGSSFVIYAYHNGVFHDLKDMYENGKISADSIKKIAKVHKAIEPPHLYDDNN